MDVRDLGMTFAGGGNRAFYQLGFMNRWAGTLLPRVAAMSACSAGACVATLLLTGRQQETAEFWRDRRKHVVRNIDLANLFKPGRPIAPHGPIYRDTLLFALNEEGFSRIRATPFPIEVLATKFPGRLPPSVAVATGIGAYQLEKAVRSNVLHPSFGRALGFEPFVVDARECSSPTELTDLIISSSATPPFTPIGSFRANRLLDGGLIDNVPAFIAERHAAVTKTLILLTRPYPRSALGWKGSRLYLAPTEPIPISRWDYTRPELIEETIKLGERDAERHRLLVEEYLA